LCLHANYKYVKRECQDASVDLATNKVSIFVVGA
jgi:hypothetical protein